MIRSSATSVGLSGNLKDYLRQAASSRLADRQSIHQTAKPVKLLPGDIVRDKRGKKVDRSGLVSQVYENVSGLHSYMLFNQSYRPLVPDEVAVMWQPIDDNSSDCQEIVWSRDLELVDRAFEAGDVCKLYEQEAQSGVIVKVSKTLKLQHVFTKEIIDHPVPSEDVVQAARLWSGDHVVYNGWVGEIEDVLEHMVVEELGSERLGRVTAMDSELPLGKLHGMVDPRNYDEQHRPAHVVERRQIMASVNWLTVNPNLTLAERARLPRPPVEISNIDALTLVKSADNAIQVDSQVVFDSEALRQKHGGKRSVQSALKIPVEAMWVLETNSRVTVTWQDGSSTREDAKSLIPCKCGQAKKNIMLPGEAVWWHVDGQPSVQCVIQSIDPPERTLVVRPPNFGPKETIPLLETSRHFGTKRFNLKRGDVVLLLPSSNKSSNLFVEAIGWCSHAHGTNLTMQRKYENEVGQPMRFEVRSSKPSKQPREPSDIDWHGIVHDLLADGSCVVVLANGKTVIGPRSDLLLLRDKQFYRDRPANGGFHQDHHVPQDEIMVPATDPYGQMLNEALARLLFENIVQSQGQPSQPRRNAGREIGGHTHNGRSDERSADSSNRDVENTSTKAKKHSPLMPQNRKTALKGPTKDTQGNACDPPTKAAHAAEPSYDTATMPDGTNNTAGMHCGSSESWTHFEVRESAPSGHHFYNTQLSSSKRGPAFMRRLRMELNILQSSLPGTILVRAYEDRVDLLRVLIFGAEGTPYEHAPFLFDMLLTKDFPREPPKVFFHSWTDMHGSIAPNLYEDGTVCLSLLGTSPGKSTEFWNPTRSTLLQILVSIQALVLVREPFRSDEQAYKQHASTPAIEKESALYSENAYILSRTFVRHALTHPVDGFEEEISTWYLQRGNLEKIIRRSNTLLASTASSSRLAIPSDQSAIDDVPLTGLTKGGAIMLTRIVKAFEGIMKSEKGRIISA